MDERITTAAADLKAGDLQPLEVAILSITPDLSMENVLQIYDFLLAYTRELKRLKELCEDRMIEWMIIHGKDLDQGNGKRYYVGHPSTTKCNDLAKAVEALLGAVNGDFTQFCSVLSSNAIKYGAAREVLPPEEFDRHFTTTRAASLEESKPKVMTADAKFTKGRKKT